MYLLALDSTGTQPYIFGSNRLRHNIGASHLVAQATGAWALGALAHAAPKGQQTNVEDPATLSLRAAGEARSQIEKNDDLAAEVLYAGGGNVVALFRREEDADAFRKRLSHHLVERAPGLTLVDAGASLEWGGAQAEERAGAAARLSAVLDTVLRELGRKKAARRVPPRPVGRSVTRRGQIHGQPAVGWKDPPAGADPGEASYPISAEAKAKEDSLHHAHQRLRRLLPLPEGYAYPYEMDNLGRAKGEQSLVAVVHADGDRMGRRLQSVARQDAPAGADPDRAFARRMRAFSEDVREAARGAMRDVVRGLYDFVEEHREDSTGEVQLPGVEAPLELQKRGGQWLLPLRPIVFGGDDVTFVCDGRLGPALAARYARRFEARAGARETFEGRVTPTASAGVAIVKSRSPFSRAYDLSEELARSAKDKRADMDPVGSCMDWHLALGDIAGPLEKVRAQYEVSSPGETVRQLTVRPVAITGGQSSDVARWETLRARTRDFRTTEHARGKLKQLRETLPKGEDATAAFVEEQGMSGLFPGGAGGYHGDKTPYLDALELMDFAVLDDALEAYEQSSSGDGSGDAQAETESAER